MSKTETSDALLQIAAMYEKGDQLPKSDEQAVLWLRKAAEIDSRGKLRLAVHLLNGPGAPQRGCKVVPKGSRSFQRRSDSRIGGDVLFGRRYESGPPRRIYALVSSEHDGH